MAERRDPREPRDDLPRSPVVRHGQTPDPAAVSPVRSTRAAPPRRGPGPPPSRWPGPVLRRNRDPFPDGYAVPGHRGNPSSDERPLPDVDADVDTALDAEELEALDVEPELLATLDPTLVPDEDAPLRGPEPGPLRAVRRKLGKALVPGERILVAQRKHVIVLIEPFALSFGVLLLNAGTSPYLGDLDLLRNFLTLVWLGLTVRAVWHWLHWANAYFVVTDRRILSLHGIFDVKRDMMPLMKVTDMAFERPFWGRPFNYGRFVLESAGKDQALREISFVANPENVDAIIGRQIFARPPIQNDPFRR